MGKYDNVTAKQLHEKKMEMLNDIGRTSGVCGGVKCNDCPLERYNNGTDINCGDLQSEHFDEYVKIIMEYKE